DDGDADLLLTLEWGPVKVFVNADSRLSDDSSSAGTAERRGWWNAITAADIDSDGDTDYVVLNVGLNTKYGRPSDAKPALLYAGNVDGSGNRRLIEAKSAKSGEQPVRGLSCSRHAMPSVGEECPTFRDFASKLLDQIYTPESLAGSTRLHANHFASGVYVNDGAGRLTWREFPTEAQLSPGYGTVALDTDADGWIDLHAVQNLYTREPETGLWRGGFGFTMGTAKDGLAPRSVTTTGLLVDGDGKGLAVADLDSDGRPDLVATQNNGPLVALRHGKTTEVMVALRLKGPRGNLDGVGAKVDWIFEDGRKLRHEISAGSGYLSQSSPAAYVGRTAELRRVEVTWPDGKTTQLDVSSSRLELTHPDA
ncbi:MAG: CRTAC1 family protein, partial [Planctomycetota bacterium]